MPPNNGSSRSQQLSRQQRVAERLGVDADQVATRDTLDRGITERLTSDGVGAAEQAARSRVASSAEFVRSEDVAADVGRQSLSVDASVAEDRRDDVAQRARASFASSSDAITPADVEADVGSRGVSELLIPDNRQDDVASRVESNLLNEIGEGAKSSDLNIEVGKSGIEQAKLKSGAESDIAARRLDEAIEAADVDTDDITETGDGFRPTDSVLQRAAATRAETSVDPDKNNLRSFLLTQFDASDREIDAFLNNEQITERRMQNGSEVILRRDPIESGGEALQRAEQLRSAVQSGDTVDAGEFDSIDFPVSDLNADDFAVKTSGDSRQVQIRDESARELAAERIEQETSLRGINPLTDLSQQDSGGFALTGSAQREFAADQFEEQTALESIDPNRGLRRADDGFGLSSVGQRRLAADQFEDTTDLENVDPQQDILLNEDGGAELAGETEKRLAANQLDERVDADISADDVERVAGSEGDGQFTLDEEVRL